MPTRLLPSGSCARRKMTIALMLSSAIIACSWSTQAASAQMFAERLPTLRIELRHRADVKPPHVLLGDVTTIVSQDLATLQRLMALPLGPAPRVGDTVNLEREALMRWIRARTGIEGNQITWIGPQVSRIRVSTRVVSGEQVARQAKEVLSSTLLQYGLHGDINVLQMPQDMAAPTGQLDLKVRTHGAPEALPWTNRQPSSSADPMLAKRQSVWVDVWVDGHFVRTVPVSLEVSVIAPAYVAAQDLHAGQMIDPLHPNQDDLVLRDVEWSGQYSLPLKPVSGAVKAPANDLTSASSMRLRRPVAAGKTLTRADVENAPLVTRGDFATLYAIQGMIELESRVEVLQDGLAGQTVRVKLPNASNAILARVTGPGTVEVRQ